MIRLTRGSLVATATSLAGMFLAGCNDTGFENAAFIAPVKNDSTGGLTVCDPFGGSGGGSRTNGIEAALTYLPSNSPVITSGLSVASFESGATDVVTSPARLILSQLAVSTRPFTEGFSVKNSSDKLTDLNGDVLDEYFSVRGSANIRLAAGDPEGDYEMALLSDDGSVLDLDVNGNGNYARWIDSDGTHANGFTCAPSVLHLTSASEIPMRIKYYQGPRVRIALMLLWRPKAASAEPECGSFRGDTYFFQPVGADPSVPTANYNALLARGWKPLAPGNFVLPDSKTNPCVTAK
ncbi:MAG: hypothetical protein JST04_06115 [Bdellovibrionales bacterium]|nr:hypothetical protein [Bdellovibrionales bacterium]